jgi:hypothetical protein
MLFEMRGCVVTRSAQGQENLAQCATVADYAGVNSTPLHVKNLRDDYARIKLAGQRVNSACIDAPRSTEKFRQGSFIERPRRRDGESFVEFASRRVVAPACEQPRATREAAPREGERTHGAWEFEAPPKVQRGKAAFSNTLVHMWDLCDSTFRQCPPKAYFLLLCSYFVLPWSFPQIAGRVSPCPRLRSLSLSLF